MLADASFTICTGGFLRRDGSSESWAHERGGRVIGMTMNQFKSEPNRYLSEKFPSEDFMKAARQCSLSWLHRFGGMGTVTEISLVWNRMQTHVKTIWSCLAIMATRRENGKQLAVPMRMSISQIRNVPDEAVAIIVKESANVMTIDQSAMAQAERMF